MLTFLRPLYLTFLVSIPFFIAMHFLILKHIRRRALKFANFEIIEKATGGQVLNKNVILLIIRLCAMILLIFSAAGTILWYSGKASSFDFVVAIDASSSMLANDFKPSRIEAAKIAANEFVGLLPQQTAVGVVSFAGTSFVEQQVTNDRGIVKDRISEIEVKPVGGTDLGEAVVTATNMLLSSEKSRAVVLLTDGQSNVGTDPDFGAEYANNNMVTVFTIGMATAEGGEFSRIGVVSKLDADTLISIAQNTGGKFYLAVGEDQLSQSFREIALASEQKISVNLQLPLLLFAILLLFIEWGLINTKYRILP
ncbi:MAG: VWA domain-containing protein [Candidatus Woesearchaeota archaeon]